MTPKTSMRRSTLITDLFSVPEVSPSMVRPTSAQPRFALLLGALLFASGCQSINSLGRSLARFSAPPIAEKPNKLDKDKSVLALLDREEDQDQPGLPLSSKAKPTAKTNSESLTALLDRGESALSTYYKDESPAHLTEAHRCYEQALALEGGNPEAHHGLGIVCDLQQNYRSAEIHYRAALDGDPENSQILGDLGWSYALQNRLAEAEQTLSQTTRLDPGNSLAIKNLAYVYAKQGNYNLADSTFRRVMNDVEVRQEMAQLFPQGRPDMAREGDRAKMPWQRKEGITTEELDRRLIAARNESTSELRDKRTALEAASPAVLTIEQQQAEIAQLTRERDEALRMMEDRSQQLSNTPLVLDNPHDRRGEASGMQIQPQYGPRSTNTYDGQYVGAPSPNSGRRVQNGFFPNNSSPQFNTNPPEIQQAGDRSPVVGPNGQPIDQALHQTNRGIDPRTGRPWNSQLQQLDGQQSSLVPGGLGAQDQSANGPGSTPSGRIATFEEAKRRAAMKGMGGPESMFPLPTPESGNRMAPGSGSTFNGGQFPQPPRMLPMDAAPHDLRQLMQAPSGSMTVQPNNLGQWNSPASQSFSNPNLQQPLSPQIPIESPLGSQGTNYQDQVDSALRPGPQPRQPLQYQQQYDQYQSQPNDDLAIPPRPLGQYAPSEDPRDRVNSELNQYGQAFQHNPSQPNSNSWSQTSTPANGLPNQPQVGNPNELMGSTWNPQQLSSRMMPPPYVGRSTQSGGEEQYSPEQGYGAHYGNSNVSASEYGTTREMYSNRAPGPGTERRDNFGYGTAGGTYSDPPPIYSTGVHAPAAYNGGNRSTYSDGQGYNGPRITPARQ
jgi:tetratricopeptide (TPR) repeat protein